MYQVLGSMVNSIDESEPIFRSTYVSATTERVLKMLSDHIIMTEDQLRHTCWGTGNRNAKKRLEHFAKYALLKKHEFKNQDKTKITAYSLGPTGCLITKRGIPEFDLQKATEIIAFNQFYMAYQQQIKEFQAWVGNDLLIGEIEMNKQKYSVWCPRQEDLRVQGLKSEIPIGNNLLVIAATMPLVYWCVEVLKTLPVKQWFTVDNLVLSSIVMQVEDDTLTQSEF